MGCRSLGLGLLAVSLAACGTVSLSDPIQAEIARLTPLHFRSTAETIDGGAGPVIISTAPGYVEPLGPRETERQDNFLRARVDRTTGAARIEVDQALMYAGDWRFYMSVEPEAPPGMSRASLRLVSRDRLSCAGAGCIHTERVLWEIEEARLRELAGTYRPEAPEVWRFTYIARHGGPARASMPLAEVVGLVQALDDYRARNGFSAGG